MKKCVLSLFLALAPGLLASAQPIYWDEGRYFSLNVSCSRTSLGDRIYDLGAVEFTSYPSPSLGFEYSTRVEFGKNYISFEPMSLLGTVLVTVSQLGESTGEMKLFSALLATTAAKIPIYPLEWLEITPYWNLMKFTFVKDVYEDEMKLTGDLGLQLKVFPFVNALDWYDTFFISPFVRYDFNYDKDPRLKGYSAGVSAGIYF